MFTYEIMSHLPPVPAHFIQEALEKVKGTPVKKLYSSVPGIENFKFRNLTLANGGEISSVTSLRYNMSQDYESWVRKNIKDGNIIVGVNQHNLNSNTMGPHVDDAVSELLCFLVQEGGDNVETVWWQEQGHPAERLDKIPTSNYYDPAVNDYTSLFEISRVRIPMGVWVRMNTRVLHSVENITSTRTLLTVRY